MPKDEIILTENELRLMSLFSTLTGISPRDCVIDDKFDRLIFVVDEGTDIPRDKIAREAMDYLRKKVNREVEIVEYSDDPVKLIKNALGGRGILDVRIIPRGNAKVAIVVADPKEKGRVVGRQGRNAERARLLAKRYHGIDRIQVS
ncbi:MAG: NusA-like transcription termination signal-binding factor [Conexivisphaera sp.]